MNFAESAAVAGLMAALTTVTATAQSIYRINDIGTFGGSVSQGYAINEAGHVTGSADRQRFRSRAFRWNGLKTRDLGTLGGLTSYGEDINDSGVVTGAADATSGDRHAFIWARGVMQDLGTLGGTYSYALAINQSGQITGDSNLTGDLSQHAFLWDGSAMRDLGTLGGDFSNSLAINGQGLVAGVSRTEEGVSRAFVWDGNSMRNIDTLNGSYSVGEFINEAGQVAGTALDVGNTTNARGFHWAGATMEDIGTLGGLYSLARGMNELGQVTGESSLDGDVEVHAFLWDNGLMLDLGTFGGTFSIGLDVNDAGQVTGYAYTPNNETSHGFLWEEGTLHNLNDLIDPADPLKQRVIIHEGRSINNRGYISALGTDTQGLTGTAYVLTPATPGDLRANTGTTGTGAAKAAFVRLVWSDTFSDESQFRIERAPAVVSDGESSCGAFRAIAIASQNAVRFLDTTVSRLTGYCYQLRVFTASAVPSLSNVARTTTK